MIIKLRRFKKYLSEIQSLKAQVNELQDTIGELHDCQEETLSRANRRAKACENERIEHERQAESDRWYREGQLKSATRDLERAVSYGDEYGIKRATEKLKRMQ